MAKHQRYFPVEGTDGQLLPRFVAIRNGDERSLDVVRKGHEMVIVARFADARFYHDEDTKRPLADRLPDLERVTFMERQGSLRQKTDRIVALVEELGAEVGRARKMPEPPRGRAAVQVRPRHPDGAGPHQPPGRHRW